MTSPSTANRSTYRKLLATGLQEYFVANSVPVKEVVAYQVARVATRTPLVVVASAGSQRNISPMSVLHFNIHIFVLYAGTGWTEEESEDRLDLVEKTIADYVLTHCNQDFDYQLPWRSLEAGSDRTEPDSFFEEGLEYRHETVPLVMLVDNIS